MKDHKDEFEESYCDFDDEFDNTIILINENGKDKVFEILDLIEYDNKEYAVLLSMEDSEYNDEFLIFKVDYTNNYEEVYEKIDDEEIVQAVFEIFKETIKCDSILLIEVLFVICYLILHLLM